jgi:hypothetical protein
MMGYKQLRGFFEESLKALISGLARGFRGQSETQRAK